MAGLGKADKTALTELLAATNRATRRLRDAPTVDAVEKWIVFAKNVAGPAPRDEDDAVE